MPWETKNPWLTLLQYLLYCHDLKLSVQYLQEMSILVQNIFSKIVLRDPWKEHITLKNLEVPPLQGRTRKIWVWRCLFWPFPLGCLFQGNKAERKSKFQAARATLLHCSCYLLTVHYIDYPKKSKTLHRVLTIPLTESENPSSAAKFKGQMSLIFWSASMITSA